MAPRFTKRVLEAEDLKDPDELLQFLNPLHEAVAVALNGGVALSNLRHVMVTAKVTPPNPWTALELLAGCTLWNSGSHDTPSFRWKDGDTEYKGLLRRPAAGASFVAFARIPEEYETLRPRKKIVFSAAADGQGANVDLDEAGNFYLSAPTTFNANGFVSLWGLRHESTLSPPLWAGIDAKLAGEKGQDYGEPALVLCLGATRKDRVLCHPGAFPVVETPLVGEGRSRERKLRIRRIEGLEAGIEHDVRFLCLYP